MKSNAERKPWRVQSPQSIVEEYRDGGDLDLLLEQFDDSELIAELRGRKYDVYGNTDDVLAEFPTEVLRDEVNSRDGFTQAEYSYLIDCCTDLRTAFRDGKRDEVLRIVQEMYRNALGVAV